MKIFATRIHALDPLDGEYKTFAGPDIKAPSASLAFDYCQNNGMGYCHIDGEAICDIPCDENYKADFDKQVDYDIINSN